MRWTIYALIVLCTLAGAAHADPPTKTLAQGGWFAISGGANQDPNSFCSCAPCTDTNFILAYGFQLRAAFPLAAGPPAAALLYPTRSAAESALKSAEFSLFPIFCDNEVGPLPPTVMVSGFVKYTSLGDVSLATLRDNNILQDGMFWAFEYIQAVHTYAQFTGSDNLFGDTQNFIDPETGFSVQSGSRPFAFMQLDQMLYNAMRKWAFQNGFVIDYLNVKNIQAKSITCPQ